MTQLIKVFWWAAVLGLSPLLHAASDHHIFLTASEQEGVPLNEPATEFACSDKIYAVIEVSGLSRDIHKLDAIWRDPRGKDREHTEYEFIVGNDKERIWVWLKLHRSTEAALVSFMNPSAGMDEFIGEWELQLVLDNKLIDKRSFSVLC